MCGYVSPTDVSSGIIIVVIAACVGNKIDKCYYYCYYYFIHTPLSASRLASDPS